MKPKKRYAFIDTQNTASTTRNLLGFSVDLHKLYYYLKEHWHCEKVFLYSGIDSENIHTTQEFASLAEIGCIIKTRGVFSYKKPDKTISITCSGCGKVNTKIIHTGYNRKSNCDVDLTVDAMEEATADREFLIFTGDGDFDYLITKLVEKGVKVYIVSSDAGSKESYSNTRRFSSRLKDLIKQHRRGDIDLIDINSWKMIISKDI